MRPPALTRLITALSAALALTALAAADDQTGGPGRTDDGWVVLVGPDGPHGWKSVPAGWEVVDSVYVNAGNPKRLAGSSAKARARRKGQAKKKAEPPASRVVFNGPSGRAPNLITTQSFGDAEVHLEYLVPIGSNSGIKMEGVYEVQIFDSYGVPRPTASHSGGVYPRAELLPKYHHIDEGYPPLVNAARPAGEWQTLDITFHAPKFDESGKKVANARFDKVVLNGRVVQENLEVPCPTGHVWRNQEQPSGPILLQGDHGPVAFRDVRVRPLGGSSAH